MLQNIKVALGVQDGESTLFVVERQPQRVDADFRAEGVAFLQHMGLDDLVSCKVQVDAVVQPGQLQVAPRVVGFQERQPDAAVAVYLLGAVKVYGVRRKQRGGQQAAVCAVPLDFQLAGPVPGGGVKVQRQAAAAVRLAELDVQHRRVGKGPALAGLHGAP